MSLPPRPLVRALRAVSGIGAVLTSVTRGTRRSVRRSAVFAPVPLGGQVGAALAGSLAMTPSLLPRTAATWGASLGFAQIFGYTGGALAERALRRMATAAGSPIAAPPVLPRGRRVITAALFTLEALAWWQGLRRQREVSGLIGMRPLSPAAAALGSLGGTAGAVSAVIALRSVVATAQLYRRMLDPYLPPGLVGGVSLALTAATVAAGHRMLRARLAEHAVQAAEAANRMIAPDVPRPESPLRSGSVASTLTWSSLGHQGRRIVAGGASTATISAIMGRPAGDPIRVYAGRDAGADHRTGVQAVLAELDRTGAWDRSVLALFTGTGTGWLQEWSLSAIEFLTVGDCATASLQYSVLPSGAAAVLDRHSPQEAGRALFAAVQERLAALPEQRRPRLVVAGESLGAYGGLAAFDSLTDMLDRVDGAVWTGVPGFTRLWQELERDGATGSPAIAPVIDHGRRLRVVTRPEDLHRSPAGPRYVPWESPRVVVAQHASDPVARWTPSLLWSRPRWLTEPPGHDVSAAMRWFPWITFWQVAADMPLSAETPSGHGHSYREEMVEIWAHVLAGALGPDSPAEQVASDAALQARIIAAIRRG